MSIDTGPRLGCNMCGAEDHGALDERWSIGGACPVCLARKDRIVIGRVAVLAARPRGVSPFGRLVSVPPAGQTVSHR
jgi:hypothetical protein